jgi:hypothetical protein
MPRCCTDRPVEREALHHGCYECEALHHGCYEWRMRQRAILAGCCLHHVTRCISHAAAGSG